MKINEIFKSIQGESSYAGRPCIFIRTTGCNLRCNYCDTTYSYENGMEMSINSILETLEKMKIKLVCVTGGEPLSQVEASQLIQLLIDRSYTVLVETNGSYDIRLLPEKSIKIVDIKCPSSHMTHMMNLDNLKYLTKKDEVKFVISSKEDYDWTKEIINSFYLTESTNVLIGTVYNKISLKEVAQWILDDNLNVRFQLQLHKYIWGPDIRGV